MNRLEQLPEMANRQLGGLEATPTLLAKIKLEAAERQAPRRRVALRPVLAVCAALVLCVGAVLSLDRDPMVDSISEAPDVMMDIRAAGITQPQPSAEPAALADVPRGSITMSAGKRRTVQQSLFAQGDGAAFPLITLHGATYRLLESPAGISNALLGDAVGVVNEYNVEPALGRGGVVSNIAPVEQPVYKINGMGSALVACEVEGATRVFQRVSYAGTAIIGGETLRDTLCDPAQVAWLEVEGLGLAEGEQAQALMGVLLDSADFLSTSLSGDASMQIGLQNGLTLQLMAGEDTVSGCGTWSCPDFFEAFVEATRE